MKASIIIPAYNAEKTIAETLNSALAQTYKDFEVIVVDDGSTDDTLKVISDFFGVVKIAAPHEGIGATRNRAIAVSKGEYILPLDADDLLDLKYLEKTIPLMTSGVGIVSTAQLCFGLEACYIPAKVCDYQYELQGNDIPITSLIRKQAILDVGGYSTEATSWEDWCLWLDILRAGWKRVILNEPLFKYRRRANSLSDWGTAHRDMLEPIIRKKHPDFRKKQPC